MRNFLMFATALAALTVTTAAEATSRINHRQHQQQNRIYQGIRTGSLTQHEARQLAQEQARIARYEAVSRRDGAGLSSREIVRLEAMQDRASRHIAAQKRDNQRRH